MNNGKVHDDHDNVSHNSDSGGEVNSGVVNKYTSKDIYLDVSKLERAFCRADIEIHNVDHSGSSYEGRMFLNNPDANESTELTLKDGYVGSYHIFGHGGCFGGMGHCEIPSDRRRLFDHRPSHHLRPQYKRIIITDALKELGKQSNKFNITILAVSYGPSTNNGQSPVQHVIKFDKIGIITYS